MKNALILILMLTLGFTAFSLTCVSPKDKYNNYYIVTLTSQKLKRPYKNHQAIFTVSSSLQHGYYGDAKKEFIISRMIGGSDVKIINDIIEYEAPGIDGLTLRINLSSGSGLFIHDLKSIRQSLTCSK